MSDDLKALIRNVPNFPKPGIIFRDITPLLADAEALRRVVDWMENLYREVPLDAVVGIESRGFIFGVPLAERLNIGFVPVRKPGKLPVERYTENYALEYGTGSLEIHRDSLHPKQRVVIVDDLLATGGTALAASKLVEKTGAEIHAIAFLIELTSLHGRERLQHYNLNVLLDYGGET